MNGNGYAEGKNVLRRQQYSQSDFPADVRFSLHHVPGYLDVWSYLMYRLTCVPAFPSPPPPNLFRNKRGGEIIRENVASAKEKGFYRGSP